MHPFFGRLIVNFVLCLICFIAYSSQIFIIWPWYGGVLSVELLTLLVPFNIFVGLLLWNYFLCVFTDPGRVPPGWRPDTNSDGYEVKKLTGTPRYCRMCENYKPPRAHHCRQCNRSVLRMDHHCPWINNCVGHFNYGHFIRFLFFVDVACSYHLTMVTKRVLYSMGPHYWDDPSTLELVMIIMNYVACVPVLLAVGGFSIYHLFALLNNTTTIEGWEKDKVSVLVKRGKAREVKFPYDLGRRRNIESILGKNPLLWCLPSRTPGSGLKYELSNSEGTEWHATAREASITSSDDGTVEDPTSSASPWTYENGSVNPALQPSSSGLRSRKRKMRPKIPGTSSLPPYHPDYREDEQAQAAYESYSDSEESISSDDAPQKLTSNRVRRGSEGYEIRQESRDEMLRRYLREVGEDPDRYLRYIPQPDEDSEPDDEEDNIPLASYISKEAVQAR
ncbi:palmitoyltransferase PFA4 [Agrocybe pediades]|nr:palmitoyltransferase PFA4 [Agrocybe pediades]